MEVGLFDGGPPVRLEGWLHLRKPGARRRIVREAVLTATTAWLPLVLLTAAGELVQEGAFASFLRDVAVHARNLVALPALILAEAVCIPRLSELALHFIDSGLIQESDRGAFEVAVASTKRLRDSPTVEVVVLALAYVLTALLAYSEPRNLPPRWQLERDGGLGGLSPAGWWHLLVSLPFLLVLVLGWIWRVVLWARFLWRMSRLRLRLLPSHPDRNAGLRFVGDSLRGFTVTAFAFSAIVAGGMANRVLYAGASPLTFRYLVLGLVLFELALFAAPLFVFCGKLVAQWRQGILDYGALSDRVGHEFERDWLVRTKPFAESPLKTGAFSATTDLYSIARNVYDMRIVPVDARSALLLIFAALLPFLFVVLLVTPADVMLERLARLLI